MAVVAAPAAALVVQATAVRRAGGVSVLTTASTGSITTIGVELGRGRGALDADAPSRVTLVAAYVAGAVLGAALCVHTHRGSELLVVPCLALGAVVVARARADRPQLGRHG